MSSFFINRPIFAMVISIVIMIMGGLALVALPIARYPEIAPPTISVNAIYPGADAMTVAETVATPIEEEINGVEGMIYMSSQNTNSGAVSISVTFDVGTDLDMANVLVQNRVSTAMSKLPEEVTRQGVTVKKKSNETTMFISIYSDDPKIDELFLSNYVSLRIRNELARVDGVGDVGVFGVGDYSMRLWLDPDKLKNRGLSAGDVIAAIREQNVQVAAGQIGEPPVPPGQAYQYTVRTKGRLSTVEEFENIIIKVSAEGGGFLRVKDVAEVQLGSETFQYRARFNGKPSAAIAIYQVPGANAIAVADGVRAKLDELSGSFPVGLKYAVPYDTTDIIRASIKEVVVTLFITIALVVFTVLIFLQSFRATIVPAVTIPVSLIGTFAVLLAMGFSLNQLTLFGLVLVIGIVVDDAIVVVENVTRHLDESKVSPKKAAQLAMQEVSGPIVATTLVLLAVFVPTAFWGGLTGQLFKQFAITISVATIFSSINALTLSPALCGILMRPTKQSRFFVYRLFNRFLDGATVGYRGIVGMTLRRGLIVAVLYVGMLVATGVSFTSLPGGFVPQEDEGACFVNIQLPDGASQERTQAVVERVEEMIRSTDGVADVLGITGFSVLDGAASNSAFFVAVFDDWEERPSAELSQEAIVAQLMGKFQTVQEAFIVSFVPPSLPGLGTSGGITFNLQDRGGVGIDQLSRIASEVVRDANAQSGLTNVYTTFRPQVPQLMVDINREQVKSKQVSLSSVFEALQAYLGSAYVNDFTYFGKIYKVKAQAQGDFRAQPEDITKLEVRNAKGDMVPLGAVANVAETFGPKLMYRFNVYPAITVYASSSPGFSSGQGMEIIETMAQEKLPATVGYEWADLSYQEKSAQGGAEVIFLLALILVYLVLAAQYESWSVPMAVGLAVPAGMLGASLGILLKGFDNNVYTQIGIVLLIGLSAKSAILIVEFAKVLREGGKSIKEAAAEAAHLRFRAVLMTAFSFILGVIPLLVASGAGALSRQVIGTTVFFGMLVATAAGVLLVPWLYATIQATSERLRGASADVSRNPSGEKAPQHEESK